MMTTLMKDFSANRILALLPPPEAELIVPYLELTEVQLAILSTSREGRSNICTSRWRRH